MNPVIDLAFKKIFEVEEVMIEFLNDLIQTKLPGVTITKVTYLKKDINGDRRDERGVIYDLRCKTNTDEEFIIEMQNDPQDFFEKRIRYYISKAIVDQGVKPAKASKKDHYMPWDYNTHPVLGVFFMNFYDKKDLKPICHKAWVDTDDKTKCTPEDPMYWKIQLPYYRNMQESDCKSDIDYWIYNLANMETFTDTLAFTDKKPIFKKVGDIAEYLNLSQTEQERYWYEWDRMNQEYNKKQYQIKEGIEKGRTEELRNNIQALMENGFNFDQAVKMLKVSNDRLEIIRPFFN